VLFLNFVVKNLGMIERIIARTLVRH